MLSYVLLASNCKYMKLCFRATLAKRERIMIVTGKDQAHPQNSAVNNNGQLL